MNFVKNFILCSIFLSFDSNVLLACEPVNADKKVSPKRLEAMLLYGIRSFYERNCRTMSDLPDSIYRQMVAIAFDRVVDGKLFLDISKQAQEDKDSGNIVSELGKSFEKEIENIKREICQLKFKPFSLKPVYKYEDLIRTIKNDNPRVSEPLLCFASHVLNAIIKKNPRQKYLEIIKITNNFASVLIEVEPSLTQGSNFEDNQKKMDLLCAILQELFDKNDIKNFYIDVYDKDEATRDQAFKNILIKTTNLYYLYQIQENFLEFEKNKKDGQAQYEIDRKQEKIAREDVFREFARTVEKDYEKFLLEINKERENLKNIHSNEECEKARLTVVVKEELLKIEKLEKACEIEQKDFFKTQETWEKERFKILQEYLKDLENITLKIKREEKGFWNQIIQDSQHDIAGHAVVKRCERGMWNTFKKYLQVFRQFAKESKQLVVDCEDKKVREQRHAIEEDQSVQSANIEQEEVLDLQSIQSAAVQEQETLKFKEIEKIHEVDQKLSYLQGKHNNKVRALCFPNWQQFAQEHKKAREQRHAIVIQEERQREDEELRRIAEEQAAQVARERRNDNSVRISHNPYGGWSVFPPPPVRIHDPYSFNGVPFQQVDNN